MITRKTISVWLIVEDGENKGKIVLQRRSAKEKKFPFVYQSTWAGKVEEGETDEEAVERECCEELGKDFCDKFNFSAITKLEKSSSTKDDTVWDCSNYLGKVSTELLKNVKMHEDAYPEFVFVNDKDLIYPITLGKNPQDNIVLFDDQYKILKNILNGN